MLSFNFFNQLGWIDTYVALIVVNLAISLPYSIWMIKGFVDALPVDMEESARTEGCGELQVLRFVTVPLIAPGVIVAAVFAFIVSWNEFLLAVIMTRQKVNTLTIGLLNAQGVQGVIWEQMAATGMIVMAPIFIMSFLIRKHFVQGLTMGAVK